MAKINSLISDNFTPAEHSVYMCVVKNTRGKFIIVYFILFLFLALYNTMLLFCVARFYYDAVDICSTVYCHEGLLCFSQYANPVQNSNNFIHHMELAGQA